MSGFGAFLGGLAGGAAQGMQQGQSLNIQKKYMEYHSKNVDRLAQESNRKNDEEDRLNAANSGAAAYFRDKLRGGSNQDIQGTPLLPEDQRVDPNIVSLSRLPSGAFNPASGAGLAGAGADMSDQANDAAAYTLQGQDPAWQIQNGFLPNPNESYLTQAGLGYARGGMIGGAGGLKGYADGGVVRLAGDLNKPVSPDGSPIMNNRPVPAQAPAFGNNPAANGALMGSRGMPAQRQSAPSRTSDVIAKGMLTTNALSDPKTLTDLADIYEKHGVLHKMLPYLEQAYNAKKSGKLDMAMSLAGGNVEGAMQIAAQAGTPFASPPRKVNPKDPTDHQWTIQFQGAAPQTVDIKSLIASTLDPKEFLKRQDILKEEARKQALNDAQIKKLGAETDYTMNQKKLESQARIDRLRGGGLGDGRSDARLPAPAATAEWLVKNGVHSNYKDAFNAVKTLNDKSPEAARASLIEAAMKNGSSLKEAAAEVDDFLATGKDASAPKSAIRKFNPKTGGFD